MVKLVSTNPAKNYEKLGEVEISTKAEIRKKVKEAQDARKRWKNLEVGGRTEMLKILFNVYFKYGNELASLQTREIGKPIAQSREDIDEDREYFEWYLKNAKEILKPKVTHEDKESRHEVYFEPTGATAVIVPWNYPTTNFIWGVIPNLLAGNTVVFKHSEECALVGKLLEEIVKEARLPKGVFSEVYGGAEVGEALVNSDINLISFTGSTEVGRKLYQIASKKFIKIVSELGGSAPGIVFADADIETIMNGIYYNRFYNNGQICDGLKRLIVHENIFETVVEEVQKLIESKKVGNPEDKDTDFGSLVAERQVTLLSSQVSDAKRKGARVVAGGRKPSGLKGAYYLPTILTGVKRDMRVWKEEVFGPVLPIVKFKTEQEAIELANDTMYGLGSYVFTRSEKRAERVARQIETGMVSINDTFYVKPFNPFGGYKMSGIGREHSQYGLHELCQIKVIARKK